jgi:hypothetical protein
VSCGNANSRFLTDYYFVPAAILSVRRAENRSTTGGKYRSAAIGGRGEGSVIPWWPKRRRKSRRGARFETISAA